MLCDECKKNEATYHTIKKINGKVSEKHLCSECQQKYALKVMKISNLGDFFSNLTEDLIGDKDVTVCPYCGSTSEEFLNSGYAGCWNCYKEFAAVALPAISRIQGAVQHVGKTPLGFEGNVSNEYERLKSELKKAIDTENYEQATIIRDRMRQLS